MKARGVSPIIATVILLGITVAIAGTVAGAILAYRPPVRRRMPELSVYAGLHNENVVRFHIRHIGGPGIRNPAEVISGRAGETILTENELYSWTFEDAESFGFDDWAQCQVQWRGVEKFRLGDMVRVTIFSYREIIFEGFVLVDNIRRLPS